VLFCFCESNYNCEQIYNEAIKRVRDPAAEFKPAVTSNSNFGSNSMGNLFSGSQSNAPLAMSMEPIITLPNNPQMPIPVPLQNAVDAVNRALQNTDSVVVKTIRDAISNPTAIVEPVATGVQTIFNKQMEPIREAKKAPEFRLFNEAEQFGVGQAILNEMNRQAQEFAMLPPGTIMPTNPTLEAINKIAAQFGLKPVSGPLADPNELKKLFDTGVLTAEQFVKLVPSYTINKSPFEGLQVVHLGNFKRSIEMNGRLGFLKGISSTTPGRREVVLEDGQIVLLKPENIQELAAQLVKDREPSDDFMSLPANKGSGSTSESQFWD
jgi:hypothetical protein